MKEYMMRQLNWIEYYLILNENYAFIETVIFYFD
jgi:hypothetical protein